MFEACEIIYTGTSEQIEKFTNPKGHWKKSMYPATIFALEHHTKGTILIDTGYSDNLKDELPKHVYRLYQFATDPKVVSHPLQEEKKRDTITHILLSHFHPDHVSNIKQYPKAKKYCSNALESLEKLSKIQQYKQGFFPTIQEKSTAYSFYEQMNMVPLFPEVSGFELGYDVLGDQSCIAVATPGHAVGHYAFFIRVRGVKEYVCIACDIAWHIEAIYDNVLPLKVTGLFTQYSKMIKTIKQFQRLHRIKPKMPIVLTHCNKSHELFEKVLKGERDES